MVESIKEFLYYSLVAAVKCWRGHKISDDDLENIRWKRGTIGHVYCERCKSSLLYMVEDNQEYVTFIDTEHDNFNTWWDTMEEQKKEQDAYECKRWVI